MTKETKRSWDAAAVWATIVVPSIALCVTTVAQFCAIEKVAGNDREQFLTTEQRASYSRTYSAVRDQRSIYDGAIRSFARGTTVRSSLTKVEVREAFRDAQIAASDTTLIVDRSLDSCSEAILDSVYEIRDSALRFVKNPKRFDVKDWNSQMTEARTLLQQFKDGARKTLRGDEYSGSCRTNSD